MKKPRRLSVLQQSLIISLFQKEKDKLQNESMDVFKSTILKNIPEIKDISENSIHNIAKALNINIKHDARATGVVKYNELRQQYLDQIKLNNLLTEALHKLQERVEKLENTVSMLIE